MDKIWREIPNFENYKISTDGQIINKVGKIKSTWLNNAGYLTVTLVKNSKIYCRLVHRLVAETYIPNPNNYSDVDHINGNKLQNNVENLQYLTHLDNWHKWWYNLSEEEKQLKIQKQNLKLKETISNRVFNYKSKKEIKKYYYDDKEFLSLKELSEYLNMTISQTRYFCMKNGIIKGTKERKEYKPKYEKKIKEYKPKKERRYFYYDDKKFATYKELSNYLGLTENQTMIFCKRNKIFKK
jgi:hypothetical protein